MKIERSKKKIIVSKKKENKKICDYFLILKKENLIQKILDLKLLAFNIVNCTYFHYCVMDIFFGLFELLALGLVFFFAGWLGLKLDWICL